MTMITLNDLTEGKLDGSGVFDKLMVAAKAHLDAEFKKGAIKGAEYSQVYLGQVQAVLQTSLSFIATQQKVGLEADLLAKQILLADAQLAQTQAQTELIKAQMDGLDADNALKEAQAEQVKAQTLNVPFQGEQIKAQTELVKQQTTNAVQEEKNLEAQECLLKSQFDNSQATVLQTQAQTNLLTQKIVTERAQVSSIGVDADSVVGKQKALYQAQTDGFQRDAEQKVAKMYCDVWNVRRTTDADGTQANSTNQLDEATHGAVMKKLRSGIGL